MVGLKLNHVIKKGAPDNQWLLCWLVCDERDAWINLRNIPIALLWKRIIVMVCKNRHILTAPEEF